MLQPMPATDAAGDAQARVEKFFGWFRQLEPADQEALIKLVYNEHKIRDVVRTFAGMPTDQRQAVFQRLGLPNSSLAKWVRQARIDRGDFGPPEQRHLTSEERAELARLRKKNRELRREKDFFRLAAAHFAREQLPRRGFA